jgi:hypothetical protein
MFEPKIHFSLWRKARLWALLLAYRHQTELLKD